MNIDLAATLLALLTYFGIAALMAISLNLEYGVAGIPNFGQAFFVSIGAYIAALTYCCRCWPGKHSLTPAARRWLKPCNCAAIL
jgi:branched-chain amino acid transport system permease protein